MEAIITPLFWSLLWAVAKDLPQFDGTWRKLALVLDHSLPFVLLCIDFIFLNAIPYLRRHVVIIFALGTVYLLLNMIVVLAVLPPGQTIYPFMSWDGFTGFVLVPIGMYLFGFAAILFLEWVTFWKLRKLGYIELITFVKGKPLRTKKINN